MGEKMTFKEINQIDVSKHVEKKMNLSYLSWAWAHREMKLIDENAEIIIHEFPDVEEIRSLAQAGVPITKDVIECFKINYKKDKGGAYVKVSVVLNGRTETEYLPVMDFKNKSMVEPDSMSVNKALKRCFVKALALHGLGLYIYAGEDLPETPPIEKITIKEVGEINKKIDELAKLLDEENGKVKLGRWAVGKFASSGNEISDIDKPNYQHVMDALDEMIQNNQPKEEPTEEQESLFEGNSTKVKAQGSD